MSKYEFVKEIKSNNDIIYYTNKNGWYVSESLSYDYNKALEFFNKVKQQGETKSVKEILEVFEMA